MKYCLLIVFSFLTIASCKKVEVPQSKQEKLRASDWVVDTIITTYLDVSGADSETVGAWKRFENGEETYKRPACLGDDIIKFKENFSGTHVTGAQSCVSNEPNFVDFTWGFREADTKFYIYGLYNLFGVDVNADILYFQDDQFSFAFLKRVPRNSTSTDSMTIRSAFKLKKK